MSSINNFFSNITRRFRVRIKTQGTHGRIIHGSGILVTGLRFKDNFSYEFTKNLNFQRQIS